MLADMGACPGHFEVGCTVPMQISHNTATGNLAITPRQALQMTALVLNPVTRALTTIVWNDINGADGKSIRLEGGGLSGIPYDVAQFSLEALRSNANPFPNTKGQIDSANSGVFVFAAASVGVFSGTLYGFIAGLGGIKFACDAGWMSSQESVVYKHLHAWQQNGTCPTELYARLKRACNGNGYSAAA